MSASAVVTVTVCNSDWFVTVTMTALVTVTVYVTVTMAVGVHTSGLLPPLWQQHDVDNMMQSLCNLGNGSNGSTTISPQSSVKV